MKRRHTFALAAVALAALAVLASPAGAVSTAWTAGRLTHAVKGLTHYMNVSKERNSRQGYRIKSLGHTNYVQTHRLQTLRVFKATATQRLSALEAQNAIQAHLNGGLIDPAKTVTLHRHTPGCWYGGYLFKLRSGDTFIVCNGRDGHRGHDGAPGSDGATGAAGAVGLSAYQVWLAEGNDGSTADFLAAITGPAGPKGDTGTAGTDGTDGLNGIDGAAGLSAYQLWLGAGNEGTIADFLHSIVGPQGAKGDTGATGQSAYQAWLSLGHTGSVSDFVASLVGASGPKGDKGDPGALNATATLVCIAGNGSNAHLALGYAACHCDPNAITVYVPTS